jgi:cytochrome c2
LRRYATTLILLAVVLVLGGLAIFRNVTQSPLGQVFGYPLTPLSTDSREATTQALILVLGGGGLAATVVVMGVALAIASYRYTAFERTRPSATPSTTAAGPKGEAKGAPPGIPLSNPRSLTIFWILLTVFGVGFLFIHNAGSTFGYFPTTELAKIEVFRLPGTHINGLPSFIAGPGDMLNALQLLIGALGFAVAGTLVVGAGLALGAARIDSTLKAADKLPRTPLDRMLAYVLYFGKPPVEARGEPRQPAPLADRILVGIDLVMAAIIVVALAVWAIPILTAPPAVAPVAAVTTTGGAADGGAAELQAAFAALPKGDAAAGQAVFDPGGAGACGACHSLEADKRIVGPSLAGVAARAATRKPGYTAEMYLYESVTNPNAFVVDTFPPDVMPKTFKDKLTPQQLADVLAFLLAQK